MDLFVHAYVMVHSVSTLHEVSRSLADLEEKPEFLYLRLGPLAKQPAIYQLFKFPQDAQVPRITTMQILKHLKEYMEKEDLWREKVKLDKFMEYLRSQYDCDDLYHLGVRFQGLGLPISVSISYVPRSCVCSQAMELTAASYQNLRFFKQF